MTMVSPGHISFEFELSRSTKKHTLASGNEMISANDRMYHMTKADIARHLRAMGAEHIRQYENDNGRFLPFSAEQPCYAVVTVCPPTRRHMDAPNWYPTVKPIVDGMTDAGLFTDDNDQIITSMTFARGEKTNTGKYIIIIDIYPGRLGEITYA